MKKYRALLVLLLAQLLLQAQAKKGTELIQVTPNGHYLQYPNSTPFFRLGDTAWELFHRLTIKEIDHYLTNRSTKGFTIIQAVVLAEFDGLRKPNQYGDLPLHDGDPTKPNEKYFAFIDTVIKMAAAKI